MLPLSRRFVSGFWLVAMIAAVAAMPSGSAAQQKPLEQAFGGSLMEMPPGKPSIGGSFYVPAYSSVSISQGRARADFAVTLSIHNTSETEPLILRRIAYFDTAGKLVESYLTKPVAVRPFATVEVHVPTTDVRGGTGANFIVEWNAMAPITEPAVEALMIGSIGAGHYSFISPGRSLKVVGQ